MSAGGVAFCNCTWLNEFDQKLLQSCHWRVDSKRNPRAKDEVRNNENDAECERFYLFYFDSTLPYVYRDMTTGVCCISLSFI